MHTSIMVHLKTRKQFQGMLAHPPVARTSHFCMHSVSAGELARATQDAVLLACVSSQATGQAQLWIGALLPKRWARHAVTRNLIRRQVYAVALEHARAQPLQTAATEGARAEARAVLVRLRADFHARAHSRKARPGKATGAPDSAARFRSAASPALKQTVRRQLQLLFERAAQGGQCPGAPATPVQGLPS